MHLIPPECKKNVLAMIQPMATRGRLGRNASRYWCSTTGSARPRPHSSSGLPTVRRRIFRTVAAVTALSNEICCGTICPASRYNQMRRLTSMPTGTVQPCGCSRVHSSFRLSARAGRWNVSGDPTQHRLGRLAFVELNRMTDHDIAAGGEILDRQTRLLQRNPQRRRDLGVESLAMLSQVLQNSIHQAHPLQFVADSRQMFSMYADCTKRRTIFAISTDHR
jgi:hypothetical protein